MYRTIYLFCAGDDDHADSLPFSPPPTPVPPWKEWTSGLPHLVGPVAAYETSSCVPVPAGVPSSRSAQDSSRVDPSSLLRLDGPGEEGTGVGGTWTDGTSLCGTSRPGSTGCGSPWSPPPSQGSSIVPPFLLRLGR